MKMEEFDDVKEITEEINNLEDQVEELSGVCSLSWVVAKMGKMQLVEDLEARIRDKQEYKASRQALHLREEQETLPPEIQ